MNLEPFYELCKAAPQKDQKWVDAFCATLNGAFDDGRFMDMDKVFHLFYGKSKSLSRALFYHKKKYIIALYRWLAQEGCVSQQFLKEVEGLKLDDVVSEEELSKFYFKSLDSVIGFIDEISRQNQMAGEENLLNIKAIVILTWYQVDINEMILIKKADLDAEHKTVLIRGTNQRTITLDEKSFRLLKMYADAVNYNSFPGNTQGIYQSSAYLFRSNRSQQLNEDNIKCFVKRFNAEADAGQLISFLAIRRCGLFYEVLKHSDGVSANSMIISLTKCTKQVAFGYAKMYFRWKKKFYDDEELM